MRNRSALVALSVSFGRLSIACVGIACVALAMAGSAASAQSIRAAALAPQWKGGGNTPELRDKFHESVVRGLGSLTVPTGPNGELGEVMTVQETKQRLGEELLACSGQASCMSRALAALHINRLVATELSAVGKSYNISMRLFDGEGHELTHAEELCEICTVREAEEAVTKAASRLAAASRTFPLETAAPEKLDVIPHTKEPPPRPVTPVAPPATVVTAVAPVAPPAPKPVVSGGERKRVPWRTLGFSSLGLGIVGLAVGIPLLVIDGRPTCSAADPTHQCPNLYNTAAGGATMVAIGAVALIATIPLFYLDWRDRNRTMSSLRLDASPSLGGLSLEGRF